MKSLGLLLLCGFLGTGSGWGQRVRGGFTDAHKGRGQMQFDYYWFTGNRFDYQSEGCGFMCGSGTYQLVGDSLVLRYDAWPAFIPPLASVAPAGSSGQVVRV